MLRDTASYIALTLGFVLVLSWAGTIVNDLVGVISLRYALSVQFIICSLTFVNYEATSYFLFNLSLQLVRR